MESLVPAGWDAVRNLIYVSFIEDSDQDAAVGSLAHGPSSAADPYLSAARPDPSARCSRWPVRACADWRNGASRRRAGWAERVSAVPDIIG